MYQESETKSVNLQLHNSVSRIVGGIIRSPYLWFIRDRSNCVDMIYGPSIGNGRFSRDFGRNTHLNSSIDVVAPFLEDNEAHAEIIRRLGEPESCDTDLQDSRNLMYNISLENLTYLFYVTLWPRDYFQHMQIKRLYEAKKEFDKSLIDRLSQV